MIDKQPRRANGSPLNGKLGPQKQPAAAQGYDFVGAMVRRKQIMLPFILLGLVVGYFVYSKQPPKFASSLKLMIWTQSPPTIVNGEAIVQPVPLGKHQSLLTSQVVLNSAIKDGNLRELKTFKDKDPLSFLKGNLTAVPVDASDTLLLTAKGPDPTDLPTILNTVVSSYQSIVNEDTAAVSKESADLIQKFQEKVSKEKTDAEKRYAELIQKLMISSDPRTGQFMNPYLLKVDQLKSQTVTAERSYREIQDRLSSISDIQHTPVDRRSELLKVLSLEASKYLSLTFDEATVTPEAIEVKQENDERQKLNDQLTTRINTLEANISELELQRSQLKLGAKGEQHPEVITLKTRADFYETQRLALVEQQKKLKASIQSDSVSKNDKVDKKETASPFAVSKYDNELIKIYFVSLKRESERLKKSIELIEEEIQAEDKKAIEVASEIGELNLLATQIKDKDGALRGIVDRLSEIAVVAGNYTSTKIRVVDNPGSGYQVEPKMSMYLSVSGFLGALIGFGVILLADWADMSFRSPTEIHEKLGVPVIGRIPFIEKNQSKITGKASALATAGKHTSSANEAYRSCRTAMLFLAKEHNAKIILLTSPSAGDGKSTTATNVAISFAQAGYKTILIDADLRRPRCHVYLGQDKAPGLKDLMTKTTDHHGLIRAIEDYENLHLLSSGGHPSNPTEFFESQQFKKLLADLRSEFDFIIIDSPPVLPVADATALSTMVDMVFLVLRIRKGVELASEKAIELLRMVDGNILGVIVNGVEKRSYYSDYGKYGYNGYGGYKYYASRYYEKDNEKYYQKDKEAKVGS